MWVIFYVLGVLSSYDTARHRGIGTGISEASKRVPIFLHDVRGGKQVSSYFGQELKQTQENWDRGKPWQGSDPAATIVAWSESAFES